MERVPTWGEFEARFRQLADPTTGLHATLSQATPAADFDRAATASTYAPPAPGTPASPSH